jgi:hypothetical protein
LWVLLGVAAIIAVFSLIFFVTCLVERQYLSGDVEPATEPFPFKPSPYWSETCAAARAAGLTHAGDFATKRSTSHVKGLMSLFLSPDRSMLVAISSSSTAGAKLKKTVVWTRLASGRVLESSDNAGTEDLSGVIERGVLLNAGIGELLPFHVQRIQQSNSTALPFNPEAALQEYERVFLERGARWVLQGLAYWVDPQQTSIRMTLRGALGQLKRLFQQTSKLSEQRHRSHIRRAGSRRVAG